jgi:hypothetical protein
MSLLCTRNALPMRCNIDSCTCNIGLSHGEPDFYCVTTTVPASLFPMAQAELSKIFVDLAP